MSSIPHPVISHTVPQIPTRKSKRKVMDSKGKKSNTKTKLKPPIKPLQKSRNL